MMRDGDVMDLVPTIENAQKYDSDFLIGYVLARLTSFLLQSLHVIVSCSLVGRNDRISS